MRKKQGLLLTSGKESSTGYRSRDERRRPPILIGTFSKVRQQINSSQHQTNLRGRVTQ